MLEVPHSKPAIAVQHEMGFVDMDLEIEMERILLAYSIGDLADERIVKSLYNSMYDKKVPGFCSAVNDAMDMFNLKLNPINKNNRRDDLKTRIVEIQRKRLLKAMCISSKCDRMLLNFDFDGKMKRYLKVLPFKEAQIIFLYRARMFPTKDNFKGRWSTSCLCAYCCNTETDEHLFQCCGYMDIVDGAVDHISLMKLNAKDDKLKVYAEVLLRVSARLLASREDKELNRK